MKIRNQLFFIFLSLGISLILVFSILTYYRAKKILLSEIYENLETQSEAKKIELEEIRTDEIKKSSIIHSKVILKEKELFKSDKAYKKGIDSLLREFTHFATDYYRIFILSYYGGVINSSELSYRIESEDSIFYTSLIENQNFKNPLPYWGANRKLRFVSCTPLVYDGDNSNRYLIIEFSPEVYIRVTNNYTGLGRTGESLLLQPQSSFALNLLPTRFENVNPNKIKLPDRDKSYPFDVSISEVTGIYTITDYRDKEVISSIRKIPNSNLTLITKMDKDEIISRIYPLRNFLLIFNISFILASFIVTYLLAKYLARPIEELVRSTNKFREGDFHSRIKSKFNNNEIGLLSESFNSMADKLERKINDLDKVGYVISHDLKAPLNSIIPLTDYIREENPNEELKGESYKMLEMIKEKSLQMKDLIVEILKTAMTEKMVKEYVDVDSLVSNIISNLAPPPHIHLYIQNNLPIIFFHKVSLMQIFQNLLQNSIKYMNKDKGMIKIGFSENEKEYKFWVLDNGPGIKNEEQNQIFTNVENSTISKQESVGIGLTVVKKIIADNKGKLWIESEEGEGFSVYFTLPKS